MILALNLNWNSDSEKSLLFNNFLNSLDDNVVTSEDDEVDTSTYLRKLRPFETASSPVDIPFNLSLPHNDLTGNEGYDIINHSSIKSFIIF